MSQMTEVRELDADQEADLADLASLCRSGEQLSGAAGADGTDLLSERSAEDDAASREPRPPRGDQHERLLHQMRKCVLVHHQLSCLLIHSAAMQAGLYGGDGQGDSTLNCQDPSAEGQCGAAIQRSIESMGGSTARLFSMALRDRRDLEAMGETLEDRVEDMIKGIQSEFDLVACSAGTPSAAFRTDGDVDDRTACSTNGAASLQPDAADHEAEDVEDDYATAKLLAWECEKLDAQLAEQRAATSGLQHELERLQRQHIEEHASLTDDCCRHVQQAEERAEALEGLLEQLARNAGPLDDGLLTAYGLSHLSRPAARACPAPVGVGQAGQWQQPFLSAAPNSNGPAAASHFGTTVMRGGSAPAPLRVAATSHRGPSVNIVGHRPVEVLTTVAGPPGQGLPGQAGRPADHRPSSAAELPRAAPGSPGSGAAELSAPGGQAPRPRPSVQPAAQQGQQSGQPGGQPLASWVPPQAGNGHVANAGPQHGQPVGALHVAAQHVSAPHLSAQHVSAQPHGPGGYLGSTTDSLASLDMQLRVSQAEFWGL